MTPRSRALTIGLDVTPIGDRRPATGHGVRGIGRYLSGVVDALLAERPDWAREHVRLMVARGQVVPGPAGLAAPWITRRPGPRPQDLGWLTAWAADRVAVMGDRPDLWHANDPERPLGPLPESRTIVTVHDLIRLRESLGIRWHRRAIHRLYVARIRRAALVVVNSASTGHDVATRLGISPDRIRVVPPWVRPPGMTGPLPATDTPVDGLLLVGVSMPHKRFDLAFEVLARLRRGGRPLRLSVCGFQAPRELARLRDVAKRAGVLDAIDFRGNVDDGMLRSLYARSVLLAVSRSEGLGLPPIEAILSGGRVAAVPISPYRDGLGRAAAFARDHSAEGIAEVVETAFGGGPAADAREEVARRFSSATSASALVAAYETALAGEMV